MGKFVCFGEIMARLNPPGYLRLVQTQQLEITYAGDVYKRQFLVCLSILSTWRLIRYLSPEEQEF